MADMSDSTTGVLFTGRSAIAVDAFGRRRPITQLNKWEWAFVAVSFANIAISIGLSIARLVVVVRNDPESPDFIYSILLIANSLFCLVYVINGLLKELQYEIYMFICAATFIIFYCIVEYIVKPDRHNDLKLVRLILCCIFGPINILLACYIARQFGWLEFRILGASQLMQNMYHQAAFFISLLKFDLQASVSFVVLILQHGIHLDTEDIVVLCCGVPFCIVWTLVGRTAMRQEWKWLAIVFAILGLLSPAYVIYSVVKTYLQLQFQLPYLIENPSIVYSQFVVGFLALVVRGALFFELVAVYRNFGKGLRERAFDDAANERTGLLAGNT